MTGLRIAAPVEAITYLVLLGALFWRVVADGPDLGPVMGPVHGLAFVAYFVFALIAREEAGWSMQHTAGVIGAAVVPLGGFFVARSLED